MRCEDVQANLVLKALDPEVRVASEAHLADCSACQSTRALYAEIDESLIRQPVWNPPRHFTQRVISQMPPVAVAPPRLSRREVLAGVALGLLTAATIWAVGFAATGSEWASVLNANRSAVAWTSVALSLGVSAWFTRRALR